MGGQGSGMGSGSGIGGLGSGSGYGGSGYGMGAYGYGSSMEGRKMYCFADSNYSMGECLAENSQGSGQGYGQPVSMGQSSKPGLTTANAMPEPTPEPMR